MNALDTFFASGHVVLVGASRTPGRLGNVLARNLVSHGYAGRVDLVNPGGGELHGHPLRRSVGEVTGTPDLAVLLVPASETIPLVETCARKGIRRVVVASGGFGETGEAGRSLEERLRGAASRHGVRILGPNCVGLIDTGTGLDTSFLAGDPVPAGPIAFVSQSGAMCASVVEWARSDGFGLTRLVSLGNQVDLDQTDALESVADDPRTRVVCLYLESVAGGRRFVEACGRITRSLPVVALKVGRSVAGRRAAASHTGALAGPDAAYDAAFGAAGVVRVDDTEDLFDAARTLARFPGARSRRLFVLTNAGGPGVAAADAASRAGLQMPEPGPITARRLRALLPPETGVGNPVDVLASADADLYGEALRAILEDDAVDAAAVLLPPPPGYPAERAAERILAAQQASGKPVAVALMGAAGIAEAGRLLRDGGLPTFGYPERAVRALAVLESAGRAAERTQPRRVDEPVPPAGVAERMRPRRADGPTPPAGAAERTRPRRADEPTPPARVDAPLGPRTAEDIRLPAPGAGGWMSLSAALGFVRQAGVPVAPFRTRRSEAGVMRAAETLGYPVALKLDSPLVVHKADAGGVALALADAVGVAGAARRLRANARRLDPRAGLLVQRMAGPGVDLIVGVVRDDVFGPLVMVGSGGTNVESESDVLFALAPVDEDEARALLAGTRVARRLGPGRRRGGVDTRRIVEVIAGIARFVASRDRILELEINPLRVDAAGHVLALDARVRLGGPGD